MVVHGREPRGSHASAPPTHRAHASAAPRAGRQPPGRLAYASALNSSKLRMKYIKRQWLTSVKTHFCKDAGSSCRRGPPTTSLLRRRETSVPYCSPEPNVPDSVQKVLNYSAVDLVQKVLNRGMKGVSVLCTQLHLLGPVLGLS